MEDMTLREYLVVQGLDDYVDEYDVLAMKCHSMDQHITCLEGKISDVRLDVAKKAIQGMAGYIDNEEEADDLIANALLLGDAFARCLEREDIANE